MTDAVPPEMLNATPVGLLIVVAVEPAVEKMKENPSEVVLPLTSAGAGKPAAGRGYVKSFRYTL